MLLSECIKGVRVRINDFDEIGFQNDELLDYLNGGIQWLHRLINRERPELLARTEEIQTAPYRLTKKAIRILAGPDDLRLRLDGGLVTQARTPFVVDYVPDAELLKNTDSFPYPTIFRDFVVEFAAIRAQARNEFDMSLEVELMGRLESQILEVVWRMQEERAFVDPYYPVRHCGGDYGAPM